ncbi:ecaA [Scenedesmus sp. PABB004]|nr:ecaA [Scenedesmus sp. PABB004]
MPSDAAPPAPPAAEAAPPPPRQADGASSSGGGASGGGGGSGAEPEECAWCTFMKGGPCRDVFVTWQACVDGVTDAPGAADEETRRRAAEACAGVTGPLFACLSKNPDYYGQQLGSMRERDEQQATAGTGGAGRGSEAGGGELAAAQLRPRRMQPLRAPRRPAPAAAGRARPDTRGPSLCRAPAATGSSAAAAAAAAEQRLRTAGEATNRRALMMAGCACCAGLALLPGLQPPAAANEGPAFTYGEEAGPAAWGGTCAAGTQQSPIDLPRGRAADGGAGCSAPPVFSYRRDNAVRVKNTGTGTIQVNFEPGNVLSWRGEQLELLQFHFHTPSEHAFDGRRAAMEAHLVHRNPATGAFAVVGVLLQPPERGGARANPCLAAALAHVPASPGAAASAPEPVDPLALLPGRGAPGRGFAAYSGSLTTPPCSEGVSWLVYEDALPVAPGQVLDFMRFTAGGASYGHNARPLQPRNGRALEANCLAG